MKKAIEILLVLAVLVWAGNGAWAGNLEPGAAPAPTMHTLDEIYSKLNGLSNNYGVGVPKTGQTTSYAAGDDGDLEPGVAWPNPRFTDNGDGTVTDNLTGLIWLKNADPCGGKQWADAVAWCSALASGTAGLTDGSVAGAWHLPTITELNSLVDFSKYNPCLSAGHPFTAQQSSLYWSSTTYAYNTSSAWGVLFYSGSDGYSSKGSSGYVRAVRGGQ
ncbi:MAG: DUF1566 domain-containing protein [Desulfosalsimonadaceae bacterium]|nr:DUF1566 domain-containing protein [Desulfosalsimonadaceae bacterium]